MQEMIKASESAPPVRRRYRVVVMPKQPTTPAELIARAESKSINVQFP